MFKRDRNRQSSIRTLIDANTRIDGDLAFAGGLHLDGTVHGNVSAGEDGDAFLSVSEGACIEGTVSCPHIELNGCVNGDIVAHKRIKLGPRARVTGNVRYASIETAVGAQINGQLIHGADEGATLSDPQVEAVLTGRSPSL